MSDENDLEPADFHLAVKRREHSETPWRWEIWAAARTKAVLQSDGHYATMSEALRRGREALKSLLRERFPTAA
jgi:hypothetical protein